MYKRNQVEWAIWQAFDRGHLTSVEVPKSIAHNIRRLIDVDRSLWVNTKAPEAWQHRFAFLHGVPQGRGGENDYRLEEVVTLWLALQYLAMGLPQKDILLFLRSAKPQLEPEIQMVFGKEAGRIAAAAKDRGESASRLRERKFLPPDQFVYLIADAVSANGVIAASPHRANSKLVNFCHGQSEIADSIKAYAASDSRMLVVEIANPTVSLAYFLQLSPLAKRGRGSQPKFG